MISIQIWSKSFFEIFDFFGGFRVWRPTLFNGGFCVFGSLLDAFATLKRPCGRPFWQYRPPKFLYRTAVRTGPSYEKRQRTTVPVFLDVPWTSVIFSWRGRGGLDMLISEISVNHYMHARNATIFATTLPCFANLFQAPSCDDQALRHVVLPNYERS